MIVKRFKPSMNQIIPLITDAVSSGKDIKLTVTGYSMYPLLESMSDSVVLTKPGKISKYDVVLFKRADGSHILHRVIKIKNGVMTIAGDNETKKEYPVYEKDVEAKMKAFERNGKYHTQKKESANFHALSFSNPQLVSAHLPKFGILTFHRLTVNTSSTPAVPGISRFRSLPFPQK